MGIRSKIEGDFKAVNLAGMADDMLAQVVSDFAADRFQASNRANAAVAGAFVPYTVAVNGGPVHRGQGEMFPERQLAVVLKPNPPAPRVSRKLPTIGIDWAWDRLQGSALDRALTGLVRLDKKLGRIEDPIAFVRHLGEAASDPQVALLRYLLTRYAQANYPDLFRRMDEAKALYRVYRIISLGRSLFGAAGSESDADPGVLAWIARELRARSPVLSGAYRDAHELYADGEPLMNAADVTDNVKLPKAEEFSFTNTVPYARKIEIGKTKSGRDFVVQAESRVYERLATVARQRFDGVADIQFEMRAVIGAQQTPQRHARRPHNRPAVRYPSIVVRF